MEQLQIEVYASFQQWVCVNLDMPIQRSKMNLESSFTFSPL